MNYLCKLSLNFYAQIISNKEKGCVEKVEEKRKEKKLDKII